MLANIWKDMMSGRSPQVNPGSHGKVDRLEVPQSFLCRKVLLAAKTISASQAGTYEEKGMTKWLEDRFLTQVETCMQHVAGKRTHTQQGWHVLLLVELKVRFSSKRCVVVFEFVSACTRTLVLCRRGP